MHPAGCKLIGIGAVALMAMALALGVTGAAWVWAAPQDTQGLALFTGGVRKVLIDNCLNCHGGEKTKGEFDLSSREGLLHPGKEGPNVILGNSKSSRLMQFIRHEAEPTMPSKAEKLSAEVIDQIAAWIDAGAPYDKPLIDKARGGRGGGQVTDVDRKFWSFQPLKAVEPPAVKNQAWCRNEIDRFILAKLEEKAIAPNGAAERRKLIRRAYLDATGLPPKPDEVEQFVQDTNPKAWELVVDRLLASPQYGERWARHWLDVARFAESDGYERDYDRPTAYHYRDFVIRALNEDMPYDRFVKLQIAGDEIEPTNPEALKATGYLAAGTQSTQVTAATAEKERYDEMDDMASTIGTSLLGLTVGCARCHDHKSDPIPTADYYKFLATFTTTVRTEVVLDAGMNPQPEELVRFREAHKRLEDELAQFTSTRLEDSTRKWLESGHPVPPAAWRVLDVNEATVSTKGIKLVKQADGSFLATGPVGKLETYSFLADTGLKDIRAIKLEVLADPSLPEGGPGRSEDGNFALSNLKVSASPLVGRARGRGVAPKLEAVAASFEQDGFPLSSTVDDDSGSAWSIAPQAGQDHAASWDLKPAISFDGGARIRVTLAFTNNIGYSAGRVRLSVLAGGEANSSDLAAPQGPDVPVDVAKILSSPKPWWEAADKDRLKTFYSQIDPDARRLRAAIEDHARQAPRTRKHKALICSEGLPPRRLNKAQADIPDFYRKTFLLKRGDVSSKDGEVTAGFLQIATRMPPEGEARWRVKPPPGSKLSYRRTALANWITDGQYGAGHMLARVIVNRLWQHHFGRGLVSTPNDFGAQGSRPTHPELLDYLANQLIAGGWRLKPLHRLMMTSSAYMQSTDYDEARAAIDPQNTLWWRRQPLRLQAEAIRDSMLAVSGQLDPRMYGPGSLDEAMKRRSIYFFVKRSKLIPMMMLFDWPDSLQGLGQRSATTVAPQALALMNHPQVRAYAESLASRVMAGDPKAQPPEIVRRVYQTALGREPTSEELADSVEFIQQQAQRVSTQGKATSLDIAVADFCQAVLCLNEFIYVE